MHCTNPVNNNIGICIVLDTNTVPVKKTVMFSFLSVKTVLGCGVWVGWSGWSREPGVAQKQNGWATLCVFIIAEHDSEAGSVRDLDLDLVDSTILCKRQ